MNEQMNECVQNECVRRKKSIGNTLLTYADSALYFSAAYLNPILLLALPFPQTDLAKQTIFMAWPLRFAKVFTAHSLRSFRDTPGPSRAEVFLGMLRTRKTQLQIHRYFGYRYKSEAC